MIKSPNSLKKLDQQHMVNSNKNLSIHSPGSGLVRGSSGVLPLHPLRRQVDLVDG